MEEVKRTLAQAQVDVAMASNGQGARAAALAPRWSYPSDATGL